MSNGLIPDDSQSPELLGAVDIVAAFTALRHELKLQVRSGRELQQSLTDNLQRIEARIEEGISSAANVSTASNSGPPTTFTAAVPAALADRLSTEELRKMAEALAEVEEGLSRAVDSLPQVASHVAEHTLTERLDRSIAQATWWSRKFSKRLLEQLHTISRESTNESMRAVELNHATRRGLDLLLERVRRLMRQCEIERIDVHGQAFDPESMHALDVFEAPAVPRSHVAQQLRPAYRWRGKILRYAEVRLAK